MSFVKHVEAIMSNSDKKTPFTPKPVNKEVPFMVRLGWLQEPLKKMANDNNMPMADLVRQMVEYCLRETSYIK